MSMINKIKLQLTFKNMDIDECKKLIRLLETLVSSLLGDTSQNNQRKKV